MRSPQLNANQVPVSVPAQSTSRHSVLKANESYGQHKGLHRYMYHRKGHVRIFRVAIGAYSTVMGLVRTFGTNLAA